MVCMCVCKSTYRRVYTCVHARTTLAGDTLANIPRRETTGSGCVGRDYCVPGATASTVYTNVSSLVLLV